MELKDHMLSVSRGLENNSVMGEIWLDLNWKEKE